MNAGRFWKTLGLLLVFLGLVYAGLTMSASRSLRQAFATLEENGRPLTAEQVVPPPVPDAENAALLYQAAIRRLKDTPSGATDLFQHLDDLAKALLGDVPTDADRDALGRLLDAEASREALRLVREGTERPACRFPLDYTKGAGLELPHLADMRRLSRILCARARVQAASADVSGGWETVLVSLRLSAALRAEPLLISQLVRMAQLQLSLDTIRGLAAQGLPSDAQAAALAVFLDDRDDGAALANALDAERILMGEWGFALEPSELMTLMTLTDSGANIPRSLALLYRFMRLPPLWDRDHAAYLTVMHRYAALATEPYAADETAKWERQVSDVPRYCIITRLLAPALGQVKGRMLRLAAEKRITLAGLAVLRHRQARGAFPETLAAAGVTAPDPFGGKPLLYRAEAARFLIYSVGPDLKDDAGSREKGPDEKPRDMAWRF
jgi:hypothetical protein